MSPRRVRRLVPRFDPDWVAPVTLSETTDLANVPPLIAEVEEVWEWEEEPPREQWSEWRVVDRKRDEDPTYTPEYRGHPLWPRLHSLHPHRKVTVTWERKLGRFWVDRVKGPMAMVVRTETKTDRY